MPYVPKEYPFYLRNLEEVMIVEEEIANYDNFNLKGNFTGYMKNSYY